MWSDVVKQILALSYRTAHVHVTQTWPWSVRLKVICPVDRSLTLGTAASTVRGWSLYNRARPSTSTSLTSPWRHAISTSWRHQTTVTPLSHRWLMMMTTVTCTPRYVSCPLKVTLKVKLRVKVIMKWESVRETDVNNASTHQCQMLSACDFHVSSYKTKLPTFCSNTSVISSAVLRISHHRRFLLSLSVALSAGYSSVVTAGGASDRCSLNKWTYLLT